MNDVMPPIPFRQQFDDEKLQAVWNALNRNAPLNSIRELHNGLSKDRREQLAAGSKLALGFDTNAIFRLGIGSQGANAIDYLSERHEGKVVVPGQALQEIWNNFLAGVEPKAKAVSNKLNELRIELEAIGQELGDQGEAAKKAVETLIESHGDWTDPKALAEFDGALGTLLEVAEVSYVPRDEFYRLGVARKQTKTPPGFKDDLHNLGDYFVWADFLYGLARADLTDVDAVVLVTDDKKKDWSRNGVPHPILVAEARVVSGKEFRLWSLDDFRAHVKSIVSE